MMLLRSRLLFAAIVFGVAVVAQAQDSPQRKELRRVDLSGAAGMEVISSISEFRPGEELPRHLPHGVEAGYVVQGAMVQNPGQPPTMLATGAPILNLRDVVHGGSKVVGPGNSYTANKMSHAHLDKEKQPPPQDAAHRSVGASERTLQQSDRVAIVDDTADSEFGHLRMSGEQCIHALRRTLPTRCEVWHWFMTFEVLAADRKYE